jgi:hypothetical protein
LSPPVRSSKASLPGGSFHAFPFRWSIEDGLLHGSQRWPPPGCRLQMVPSRDSPPEGPIQVVPIRGTLSWVFTWRYSSGGPSRISFNLFPIVGFPRWSTPFAPLQGSLPCGTVEPVLTMGYYSGVQPMWSSNMSTLVFPLQGVTLRVSPPEVSSGDSLPGVTIRGPFRGIHSRW